MAGIYHQNPGITEEQTEEIFAWRLARCKQVEEHEQKLRQSIAAGESQKLGKIAES
jgi:hypothetical protein